MHPPCSRFLAVLLFALATTFCVTTDARAQTAPAWLGTRSSAGVAHFFFANRIERYSLDSRQWLPPIALPAVRGSATVGWVDAEGIYVAYDKAIYRYALDGTGETPLLNTTLSVNAGGLLSNANYLYVNYGGSSVLSIRKSTNTAVQDKSQFYSVTGFSIAPGIGKIFSRNMGVSPSDIMMTVVNADGTIGAQTDSPHHGEYPGATRTWVFPDEARVVDSAGIVYNTGNLSYVASFASAINDLQFLGTDVPIVLAGNKLTAFSNALLPTGSKTLAFTPANIYLSGSDVLCFTADAAAANGVRVDVVPQSNLNPPTPGQPVNPDGVPFTPNATFFDKDGVLYLFSKANQSVFRWNPTTQSYLGTIPLVGVPDFVAYSAPLHRLYLAYSSGLIRKIDLSDANPQEVPFANLALAPRGLATAGAYCFACDASGSWNTHYTFDAAGVKVDSVTWDYYSTEYVWSDANQKMYFFRDDTSPNDLLWEEINANGASYAPEPPGGIRNYKDSPLHDSTGFVHPIRVSPDGSRVVLGSGVIHDGTTLERLTTALANSIVDAAWLGGGSNEVRTVRTISGLAQFQQWTGATYALGATRQLPGQAHRVLALNATQLLGITIAADGVPSFYIFDAAFGVLAPPVLAAPAGLSAAIPSAARIDLSWRDVSGESAYSVERRDAGNGGAWTGIGTTDTSVTTFSDTTGLVAGGTYAYRVIARNGTLASAPSAEFQVTIAPPATPQNFSAAALSASEIQVSWSDVSLETGYVLERKVGATGSWTQVATPTANATSYKDSYLSSNTTYFYRLRAVNGLGSSPTTAEASARTFATVPGAPYFYSAGATSGGVTLLWSGYGGEDNFVIERRLGTTGAWSVIATPGGSARSYTDTTVQPETTYNYRIKAVNSAGESGYSSVVSVTTPALPKPDAPTGLTARVLSASSVRISWRDVAIETGYRLERRTDNPNSWTPLTTLSADVTTYTETGLTTNLQYSYRVVAFNTKGDSLPSNEDSATPMAIGHLLDDNFDPQLHPANWSVINGGSVLNGGAGFPGSNVLWFGAAGARNAATAPVDVTQGGYLLFKMRAGNTAADGATYWEDSETGEDVVLEYSTGGAWTTLQTIATAYPALSTWTAFEVKLPAAALSSQTMFRWRQLSHSGPSYDTWAIDDVVLEGAIPPAPPVPPFLSAAPSSDTSIAIFWQGATGATGYVVERAASSSGPWVAAGTTLASAPYFTDTALQPDTWYAYRVRAVNLGGSSPPSAVAWAHTYTQLDNWRLQNFGTTDPNGAAGSMAIGADGVRNLLKFAFNLPAGGQAFTQVVGTGAAGLPAIWRDPASGLLQVEFVRRKAASNPGVTYAVEWSGSVSGAWTPGGTLVSTESLDNLWERVRFQDNAPERAALRFGRVRVTEGP